MDGDKDKNRRTVLSAREIILLEEHLKKLIQSSVGLKKYEATNQLKKLRKKYNL